MVELIRKYWKMAVLATIVIFVLVPGSLIINKDVVEQAKNQIIEKENTLQAEQLADEYANLVVETNLYSKLNIIILFAIPILLSVQIFKDNKEKKVTKDFFIVQAILIIVPYVINAIILLMVKFIGGFGDYLQFIEIVKWLGISILMALFVVAVTDFVGCFAKNRFTHIISTLAFLLVPIFIGFSFDYMLSTLVYGYMDFSETFVNVLSEWPGLKIMSLFSYPYLSNFNILHLITYILLIGLFVFGTYKIMNKQKSYNVIPIISLYAFITFVVFVLISAIPRVLEVIPSTIIAIFITGVIYAICAIFIKQKNIKKLAISYGLYSVIIFIIVLILQGNIFGYETNIPRIEDVEYAVFSTNNPLTTETIKYSDKDNIEYLINKQKNLVENQTTIRQAGKTYYKYYIQYSLKNGDKITRAYYLIPEYEEIYDSEEFINQRYKYIINETERENLTKINIIGLYNNKAFELTLNQEDELFDEITTAITNDIKNEQVYKTAEDAYAIYGEKEGIQYIIIDIYIGDLKAENYVAYAISNERIELTKIIQNLIDTDSNLLKWEE